MLSALITSSARRKLLVRFLTHPDEPGCTLPGQGARPGETCYTSAGRATKARRIAM